MDIITTVMVSAALLIATITDIRSQRIYNWLTFPLILAGFGAHIVFGGFEGLKLAASGFGVGFALMVIPYFLGAMGAGDVKLMVGIGAWLGPSVTLTAFFFTCLAGGLYALSVLMRNPHYLKRVWANIAGTFTVFIATRKFNFTPTETGQTLPRLCYGVAIAVGTVIAMAVHLHQTGSLGLGY